MLTNLIFRRFVLFTCEFHFNLTVWLIRLKVTAFNELYSRPAFPLFLSFCLSVSLFIFSSLLHFYFVFSLIFFILCFSASPFFPSISHSFPPSQPPTPCTILPISFSVPRGVDNNTPNVLITLIHKNHTTQIKAVPKIAIKANYPTYLFPKKINI